MYFVNQNRIMAEVNPLISAIRSGNNQNLLFQGSAGCGKTLLAKFIARNTTLDWDIQIPVKGRINFRYVGDFPIHVIDEIHEFRNWENLYPYLDSGEDTFIFCTTEYGYIPEPFLTRCIRLSFDPYSLEDLSEIVQRYSRGRNYPLRDSKTYLAISEAARGSPRLAKQRFDRVKMYCQYYDMRPNHRNVIFALRQIGIYDLGYTAEDLRYLEYLSNIGTSSIENLSRALRIDRNSVQKEIEPFLIERGNIMITSKGRKFISWLNTPRQQQ